MARREKNGRSSPQEGRTGRGSRPQASRSSKAEGLQLNRQQAEVIGDEESAKEQKTPKLILVATPIGNLGDLSERCKLALVEADFWIVEDSRISGKLLHVLDVRKPMRVVNSHTSPASISRIVDDLATGLHGVLLTDGGAPGVSDPGALVANECHERGIEVDAIPGPCAVINALMLSGFFAQQFCFLGFLGRKPGEIRQALNPFIESRMTLVIFESPFRFRQMLEVAGQVLPGRRYAICRELTKAHQQVFRESLPILPSEADVLAKGEFTIVIEGQRSFNRVDDSC